jgi:hypothetical protein
MTKSSIKMMTEEHIGGAVPFFWKPAMRINGIEKDLTLYNASSF